MPFAATGLDLEIIILSEVRRKRQISYDIAYKQNLKKIQMNLFTKQKQTHRLRERIYDYQRGRMKGRDSQGIWDRHVHSAIFNTDY